MKTRYWGQDCLGNVSGADTIEGTCVQNIYEPEQTRWYNQATRERGTVSRGDDGDLHFRAIGFVGQEK